jgi:hypothetical protein
MVCERNRQEVASEESQNVIGSSHFGKGGRFYYRVSPGSWRTLWGGGQRAPESRQSQLSQLSQPHLTNTKY